MDQFSGSTSLPETMVEDFNCDDITKRLKQAYPVGKFLFNPIENNPNAKWTPWYPAIPTASFELEDELEKNRIAYNEQGEVIVKVEQKEGKNGPLYRGLMDRYLENMYIYEVREKNIEKIVYPGTV